MPKGVPKTEGEKINDKFEAGYKEMRREYKRGRAEKKKDGVKTECKACQQRKCECGK